MCRLAPCAFLVAAGVLTACSTDLSVTRATPGSSIPVSSWTYSLAFKQFDLLATRTFTGCKYNIPQVSLQVSGTASLQPDPKHLYIIDPTSLMAATKISDLRITWFSNSSAGSSALTNAAPAKSGPTATTPVKLGTPATTSPAAVSGNVAAASGADATQVTASWMLQSINASAEDRTGQTISAAVTGIATLATTIAAHGAGGLITSCEERNKDRIKALKAKKILDAAVQAATNRVAKATQKLNLMTSLASAGGSRLDVPTLAMLLQASTDVVNAIANQQNATKAATDNQAKLTFTDKFKWPLNGDPTNGVQQVIVPGGEEALQELTGVAHTPNAPSPSVVALQLEPVPSGTQAASADPAEIGGIRYRVPVPGRLIMCQLSPSKDTYEAVKDKLRKCSMPIPNQPYLEADTSAPIWSGLTPQLGPIRTLPYSNGLFQNNLLAATFTADGNLASAEYAAKGSTSEAIASSFSDTTKALTSGIKGVVTGPTTYEQSQAAKYTAMNNLITQQSGLSTSQQIGVLQANTALLSAQVAYDSAQAALAKAQTGTSAQ